MASLAATTTPDARPERLRAGWSLVAAGMLLLACLVGVVVGPADLSTSGVLLELLDRLPLVTVDSGLSETQQAILLVVRLPRVVLGALVGGALALSGASYQGVFRNPLADPYFLGVSSGAGLGATIAFAVADRGSVVALPFAAFLGAVVGVAAAYALGRTAGNSSATIILAGVAVGAFLTAIQTFVQQRNAETLREVYAWVLGRLSTTGWDEVLLVLPYLVVSTTALLLHRRLLDVLSVGAEESDALGVPSSRVRLTVVAAATLATAAAVAVSGLIGFVGIIVPHTVRLLSGSSYRTILPLSLAFGAAFLVLSDVIARSLLAPQELPIGVVTAFFGAPFFTIVLRTSRRSLG